MANEIGLNWQLSVSKNGLVVQESKSNQITMNGDDRSDQTQVIPTTAGGTALTVSAAVTTLGVAVFTNLVVV